MTEPIGINVGGGRIVKNVVVFPYGQEFRPAMEYSQFIGPEYEIKALVSPKGWRLCGQEVPYKKGDVENRCLTVQPSLSEALSDETDTVLIPSFRSSMYDQSYERKVIDSIAGSIGHFRDVICCKQFTDGNMGLLRETCAQAGCGFDDKATPRGVDQLPFYSAKLEKYDDNFSSLVKIDAPIIAVAGMGEDINKTEVALALRDMLASEGYRVSMVGSKNYCEVLEANPFPSFMFLPQIDERLKVVFFNMYVKHIEDTEKPDIIVISIPGATKAYSSEITQGFGLLHHEVFQAVLADYLVMCSYYLTDAADYLRRESETCRHRFGCGIDSCHISGTYVEYNDTREQRRIVTSAAPKGGVSQTIAKNDMGGGPILFDVFDESGRRKLHGDVMKKLNPDFVLV